MNKKGLLALIFMVTLTSGNAYSAIIDQPGFYSFGSDLIETGSILRITSSDVMIDLDGHTISGGLDGVVIDDTLTNITIKNGFIKEISNVGIFVGQGCKDITFENINFINCFNKVVSFEGLPGTFVESCVLDHCTFFNCTNDPLANNMITIEYGYNIKVQNCVFNNNGSSSTDLVICYVHNSDRCGFEENRVKHNMGQSFIFAAIDNSRNCRFTQCIVRNNDAIDLFKGFCFLNASNSNITTECSVSNNMCSNGPLYGFELASIVSKNLFNNCLVFGNIATGALAQASCFGYYVDASQECSFLNCRAISNISSADGGANIAAGFNIINGVEYCRFIRCEASANNGFVDLRSFGIRAVDGTGSNVGNTYVANLAISNGPVSPEERTQIVTTNGKGKDSGGVPSGSVISTRDNILNGTSSFLANYRVYAG